MAGMNTTTDNHGTPFIKMDDSVHNFMDLAQAFHDGQSLKILVCGKTGTGKSSLINTMVGCEIFKTGGPGEEANFTFKASTCQVTSVSTHMQNVSLEIFETPAIQDATESLHDDKYIDDIYKRREFADLVIYCVDMKETRWFPQDIKETKLLTEKFGINFWNKAVLVLTKANMTLQLNQGSENEKSFCKRVYDNFTKIFQSQLIKQGVPAHVVMKIPTVAAGSDRDKYLPYVSKAISGGCDDQGYQDFLPELWLTCFEQISGKPRDTFLKDTDYSKRLDVNKDRLPRAQKQLTDRAEKEFKEKEEIFKENEVRLNAQIAQLQIR